MEASPTYEPLEQHAMATRLMSAQPDPVLCRLAARGNVGAYDALYQRYRQPVYAFVFHLLGRADGTEDAEDIAQDTFTRAFAGIREQRVDGSFRGWLYTIARNRTYDLIRTRKTKVVSLDAEAAEPPLAPQTEQPAERAEQRAEFAWMMAAVAELPERQREALLLREMGGFSHERIANELGTTVSATKKLISRGRDEIGEAAASVGYGRISRRKLGHDLAMAAPVIPISLTLASLGVTAGTGAVAVGGAAATGALAGGGAIAGGKVAATALTVLAIGGGAVAVKHDTSTSNNQAPAAVQRSLADTEHLAPGAATPGGRPGSPQGTRRDARGNRGPDGSGRDGQKQSTSGSGGETEPSDDRGGRSGRAGRGEDVALRGGGGGDDSLGSHTESGGNSGSGSESNSGSNSGPGSGSGDDSASSGPPPAALGGEDGGSSSGSGSSGSGKDAVKPAGESSGSSGGSDD